MALAAIHNGADAIFVGVPGFNARGRSHDFEIEALREIIELCHLYRVKVNLAFNIVIFQEELERVKDLLAQLLPLKPDAFIVQDLGLVQIIRQMAPEQRIHASTQMTVTNFEAIDLLRDLRIERFVLGRENSIDDIKAIRAQSDSELEVFVHGALCVSYSGQCFTSESLGGRSANRGQCAQSCRFSYDLYVDGAPKEMGNRKYLVSPQDLCGLAEVPDLVASGLDCFKVEGRLKTPEYVATAAKAYRQALDRLHSSSSPTEKSEPSVEIAKKEMAVTYSRGFFSGWLHGVNHQQLVRADFSAHRGYEIGKVVDAYKNILTLQLKDANTYERLVPGDGLLWARGNREQGGFIYGLDRMPKLRLRVELARDITLSDEWAGATVYQNHDKELKKQITQTMEDKNKVKRLDVRVELVFAKGQPLQACISDGDFKVEGQTQVVAEPAKSRGVSDEQLREEFNSLTGSIFRLADFSVKRESNEELFLPHREFKSLRQQLIDSLTAKRQAINSAGATHHLLRLNDQSQQDQGPQLPETLQQYLQHPQSTEGILSSEQQQASSDLESSTEPAATTPPILAQEPFSYSETHGQPLRSPRLNVLLREKGQVQDILDGLRNGKLNASALDTVTLDFEFGRDYQASVNELRQAGFKVGLATTRILKPNEYRNVKALAELKPDSILVRNLGALSYLTKVYPGAFELRGDFSLNVTNHLTASYLFSKGLNSLCLSYDLNHQQVSEVLDHSKAAQLEVTIYQYMPSFHMEHCVFAAFLSTGSSYRDCGKPCEKHNVTLKDQFQNWHQIKADQECRNTMFNARAQSASRYLEKWTNQGLGFVRYEALKERGDELITKLLAHLRLLENQITYQELISEIGAIESYGLSEGALGRDREYQSRKKQGSLQ